MSVTRSDSTAVLAHWKPSSVLVLRALQIGDLLCAVPALRALRRQLPDAHICLLGLPWAREFVLRFSAYIDEFIEFPGYPGLPEREPDAAAWPAFVEHMRARRFELIVQMQGDGSVVNDMLASFHANRLSGFCPPQCAHSAGYFLPWPECGSEIERLLQLSEFLGAPADNTELEFPLLEHDRLALHQSGLASGLLAHAYICLHPGARAAERRWPPAQFAKVADALQREYGLAVVITGSAAEFDLGEAVIARMHTSALNACCSWSVGAMAVLLNGARLLICNDTGVSHIAVALRLPSIVVFRSRDIERWAPLDQHLHHRLVDQRGEGAEQVLHAARNLIDHCVFS